MKVKLLTMFQEVAIVDKVTVIKDKASCALASRRGGGGCDGIVVRVLRFVAAAASSPASSAPSLWGRRRRRRRVGVVRSAVPGIAAAGLHNYVAGCDDPTKLESSEVEAIILRNWSFKTGSSFASFCWAGESSKKEARTDSGKVRKRSGFSWGRGAQGREAKQSRRTRKEEE
uniref:Uncharacterized protein n=1 Tax=Oryza glumipatula TaxID=40148 RepID=A0A0E0BN40_9ORYZ